MKIDVENNRSGTVDHRAAGQTLKISKWWSIGRAGHGRRQRWWSPLAALGWEGLYNAGRCDHMRSMRYEADLWL